jgi:hypothetical protein
MIAAAAKKDPVMAIISGAFVYAISSGVGGGGIIGACLFISFSKPVNHTGILARIRTSSGKIGGESMDGSPRIAAWVQLELIQLSDRV